MLTRSYCRRAHLAPAVLIAAGLMVATASSSVAQAPASTITFQNRSSEPALVRLVGQPAQTIEVPALSSRTVPTRAGEYYVVIRYGTPGAYSYARGDPFTVRHSSRDWEEITITLQKVIGGNYRTRDASKEEFEKALSDSIPLAKHL